VTLRSYGWVLALALTAGMAGCKQGKAKPPPAAPGDGGAAPTASADATPAAPPTDAAATATDAWELRSTPIAPDCGAARPGAADGPVAAGEARRLARGTAIASCQKLPSIEAVCDCLASSLEAWAPAGLAGKGTCEAASQRGTDAQVVVVSSAPADPAATAAGTALVLVARRGDAWSALQVVDAAPDVDLTETPRASHGAELVAYAERPGRAGTLVWAQSQNQYSETDAGEQTVQGGAALTLCAIPAAADAPAACYAAVPLGTWDFTYAGADDRCDVRASTLYAARLDASGQLSVVLTAGTDDTGRAGRYQL